MEVDSLLEVAVVAGNLTDVSLSGILVAAWTTPAAATRIPFAADVEGVNAGI